MFLTQTGSHFQFIFNRCSGLQNDRLVVPDKQMDDFIRACNEAGEGRQFLGPEDLNLVKGQRVRITGGALEGVEGVFIKLAGKRSKRLVVMLEGIMGVSVEISPENVISIDKVQKDKIQ